MRCVACRWKIAFIHKSDTTRTFSLTPFISLFDATISGRVRLGAAQLMTL